MEEKKTACISMSKETYSKLHVIYSVQRFFFEDKNSSISKMVEDALKEYFINHKQEIDKMMKEYHDRGGCFEL